MTRILLRSLRFEHWPEADRTAWTDAFAEGDLFDGRGAGTHLSDRSRRTIRQGYARWLAFLARYDAALLDLSPADRVGDVSVRAFIDDLTHRCAPVTVWNDVKTLYDALRLMVPDKDWSWLRHVKARLERKLPRRSTRPVVDSACLVELGLQLMERAKAAGPADDRETLRQYRDGLCIALLALRPLRRRTLSRLRIGKQLQSVGNVWHLILEPEDMKNRTAVEFRFPDLLVPYLEHYLAAIRPRFLNALQHDGLWPSCKGSAMSDAGLYEAICKRTRSHFGFIVFPHAFRHAAATTTALHDPEHVGDARDLLAHRDLRTTQEFYDLARNVEAARRHAVTLANRRARLAHERPTPERS